MNDNQGIVSGSRGSSQGRAGRKLQACVCSCFTAPASQEIGDGSKSRLGRAVLSENLAEPLPGEPQLKCCWKPEVSMALACLVTALGQTRQAAVARGGVRARELTWRGGMALARNTGVRVPRSRLRT